MCHFFFSLAVNAWLANVRAVGDYGGKKTSFVDYLVGRENCLISLFF